MISYNIEFPFTLMPKPLELILVKIFKVCLSIRERLFKNDGWQCSEKNGQAFVVVAQK